MNDWKTTLAVYVVSAVGGAILMLAEGMPWYVVTVILIIAAAIIFGSTLMERRDNKKSFEEAERFAAGYAFKSQREEENYARFAAKHGTDQPKGSMLSDIVARFRSLRIVFELLGVLALGLIEIVLFKEANDLRGDPRAGDTKAVMYICLGLMMLLLYFAISNIVGIRARRLFGKLEERSDFPQIERSYSEGVVFGQWRNFINIGPEYVTLVTAKAIVPVHRSHIVRVCRADVLTAYYTNSMYSGKKDSYFIKVYTDLNPGVVSVELKKFDMIMAYDHIKGCGLPADDTIEMR